MRAPTHPRRLAAATLVLLALAGCGGGDTSEPAPVPSEAPTPTATESPTADTTSSPEGGDDDGYLPVPSGVELTEPGTDLDLKDPAVAAWLPRQDLVGVVEVAVTRIEETTVQSVLAGFDLDAEEQRSTPHFVTARVTNVGATDLGARMLPLYFLDDRGVILAPTGIARDFEPCPGSTLPPVFAPGDSATSCLLFLVPEGSELQSVMFRPPEGVVPLRWTGDVTPLRERSRGSRGRS